ncbi:MAG: primosomal protein N' [bacterium]
MPASVYAEVAFPIPLRQTFTYLVPPRFAGRICGGCRVYAPFGPRRALGYVVRLAGSPPEGVGEIKELGELIDDQPLFDESLMRLLNWVSEYYLCSLGEAMSAAYPFSPKVRPRFASAVQLVPEIARTGEIPTEIRGKQQRRVLEYLLAQGEPVLLSELLNELGVTSSPIKALEERNFVVLKKIEHLREPAFLEDAESKEIPTLTNQQEQVLDQVLDSLEKRENRTYLLHGVTGSGKTEVYLRAIASVLKQGRSALVLIPEISLTPQTMRRFRARFGKQVGILHSALGQGERFDEWQLASSGQKRVVVGTRSAVFAPLKDLGLVVVDEEHEHSYKQSDPAPRYNGRDVAVFRARMAGAVTVLGSATPAVESYYNARTGKYSLLNLPDRVADRSLPTIRLIDMRGRIQNEQILSQELRTALLERRERGEQSILFLNRRGFATSMACRKCGHVVVCPHCSVALVYHRSAGQLLCHHCEYRQPPPTQCESCHENFIQQQGFGTERVVEEVEKLIAGVRIARLDRDATRAKGQHDRLLAPFRTGEVDILVGTQMIAKGLDFPGVTLVGVINADYALSLPDFRSAERTFCLLTQVAGRSGRGDIPGEVIVQTCCPNHYAVSLALKQDYVSFYQREIRFRQVVTLPPLTRLVLWRVEAQTESQARGVAWELYRLVHDLLRGVEDVSLFPPIEAPLYRIRDYYRWHVAMKARDYRAFRPILESEEIQKTLTTRRQGLKIVQDVDPIDML